ncbi:hypothetical protein Pst134EA_030704 [Puccinia striiformis f. sp. tritici]|uniref:hypothetical protein n=1 Tax=Puccinia striiformis f. sp. tritici TaxID=168172 RepID=UPI0020073946|nr:hypothetical protein Pst134EA_030704 [Puccinia striiformis f. sp. tritici]KAH9446800.1 hypothetical protein Pst134EA_030704 [Puccinia striiformis f. sp. tritici]
MEQDVRTLKSIAHHQPAHTARITLSSRAYQSSNEHGVTSEKCTGILFAEAMHALSNGFSKLQRTYT